MALILLLSMLTACSAINTSVAKKELDVQTKMTESIFLDPVAPDKRIVYVDVKNTSDKPNLIIEPQIIAGIIARGYKVTDNPDEATYLLQANILQIGRRNARSGRPDGSATLLGAGAGSLMGDGNGRGAMAIVGALLGTMVDASVKDIYYTLITDIRLSERAKAGAVVNEVAKGTLKQGDSAKIEQSSHGTSEWRRYQTKIVSVANQANLEYQDAEPELIKGLVQNLSNLF